MDRISGATGSFHLTPPAGAAPAGAGSADAIRKEAQRGLEESDRFHLRFWKQTRLRTDAALHSLDTIDSLASSAGDVGTGHAVDLTRVAAETAASAPKLRLAVLRSGMRDLEAGVAGCTGSLATLAIHLLNTFDTFQDAGTLRAEAARRLLSDTARACATDGAPEATFAAFVDHLSQAGAPAQAALEALGGSAPTDSKGYAAAALHLAGDAQRSAVFTRACDELRALGASGADPAVQEHLGFRDALLALDLGSSTRAAIDRTALERIAGGEPAGSGTATRYAAHLFKSVDHGQERGRIARAALDATATETGAPPAAMRTWLEWEKRVPASLANAEGSAGMLVEIVGAMASGRPATLPGLAKALDAVCSSQSADAAGLATTRQAQGLLRALDHEQGGVFAEYLTCFDRLEARCGTDDASRLAVLQEEIRGISHAVLPSPPPTADPGAPPTGAPVAHPLAATYSEGALAALATRLAGKTTDPATLQNLGGTILTEIGQMARAHGKAPLVALADAAESVLTLRMADDKQVTSVFTELMKQLQKEPTGVEACAAAVDKVLNATSYSLDRLHMARKLLPAVQACATDPLQHARATRLITLASREMYDGKSQVTAISAGLQYMAKPPRISANEMAHFSTNVDGLMRVYVDYLQAAGDAVGSMRHQAQASGDTLILDACDLLDRVADVPASDEQYRAAPVQAGITWLAGKQSFKGDPYLALASKVVASGNSAIQQCQLAEAVAEVLETRSVRAQEFDKDAQSRFLLRVARTPFASHADRAKALWKGLEAIANGGGAQDDGLARVALAITGGAQYGLDQVRVAQAALTEAHGLLEQCGEKGRDVLVQTYREIVGMENYEDKYRAAVAQEALKSVATRPAPEPGELASTGLNMINQAYYFVNQLDIGRVILEGLEKLAAHENDQVFVPTLVHDMRTRMQAAGTPKAQLEVMRSGLKEIAKLKGDAFRKALMAALQTGSPADAPRIEEAEEFVIIGGIKIPKTKE